MARGIHIDVLSTVEEFQEKYNSGAYSIPWVVYIGNNSTGYDVVYSSNEKAALEDPDFVEGINRRIEALETEKVYCYEQEYDELITKGSAILTNIDGSRLEQEYDPTKLYCIYEDEGPEVEDEETENDEVIE